MQHLGDGPGNLRHLERVGEARPVVVAARGEEDLGLVLQATEGLGVDDPIAIALERRPHRVFGLGSQAAAAVAALRRLRSQDLALSPLELLANRHAISLRKLMP